MFSANSITCLNLNWNTESPTVFAKKICGIWLELICLR